MPFIYSTPKKIVGIVPGLHFVIFGFARSHSTITHREMNPRIVSTSPQSSTSRRLKLHTAACESEPSTPSSGRTRDGENQSDQMRSAAATPSKDEVLSASFTPHADIAQRRDDLSLEGAKLRPTRLLSGNASPFKRARSNESDRLLQWKHSKETFRVAKGSTRSCAGAQHIIPILEGISHLEIKNCSC